MPCNPKTGAHQRRGAACRAPASFDGLGGLFASGRPFVFLDTARCGRGNTRSFVFLDPLDTLTARTYDDVIPLLKSIDRHARRRWVAGYLSYEAAYALDPALRRIAPRNPGAMLGWFGVFSKPFIFNHADGRWDPSLPIAKKAEGSPQRDAAFETAASISRGDYVRAVNAIKRYIERGHTYQINFTYDVACCRPIPSFSLYRRLRENQPASYCAYLSDGVNTIASFSPELFFRKKHRRIMVQPMKGTARRGRFLEEDRRIRAALAADEKNRSENIMIVDLMRSDLGRICTIGSITVPRLYCVEPLPTLHQMTSTIRGVLRSEATLTQIFTSLFPSGSVTGAPKIRSMEIIRSLEKGIRGVYCGAIGYAGPRGEAVFSVPIRTLQSTRRKGRWKYRVGSGIVWNSKAGDEWKECAVKCDFLTKNPPDFELFESLLWNKRLLYKRDHVLRLKRSARYFSYPFDAAELRALLEKIEHALRGKKARKVRIFLHTNGSLRWDCVPIDAASFSKPVIRLNHKPMDERNPLLFHKTTHRPWYQGDAEEIQTGKCFDVIHVNTKGEITEGSRCNIFIAKGSMLLTPPIDCGLLPGVLRANLIRRGKCRESVLKPSDIKKTDAVYCGNSVRGLVRVEVAW